MMRISSSMIYDKGVFAIQRQMANLLHTQQQVSTGRRIVTPADDPISAARVLQLNQSQGINEQFGVNIGYAEDNLGLLENKLVGAGDILHYVRERAVQAGNGAMADEDLRYIASDMRAQFDALMSIANSRDGRGEYIFSGYMADQQPYSGDLSGVNYAGDQGERTIQVSASRYMPTSLPGTDIFDRTRVIDDSAVYTFKGEDNKGNATLDFKLDGNPIDPNNLGRRYIMSYSQPDPAVAGTWKVEEVIPGASRVDITASVAFAAGPPATASFNGITTNLPADPVPADPNDPGDLVDGDAFEVFMASTNTFDNFGMFVGALEDHGGVGMAGGVAFALENFDFSMENILKTRAQIGSQLTETESLKSVGDDLDLQYASTISRLQDVDYAEAISNLTQQQTFLQAAQQSFARISNLSLFNFID